MADVVVVVVAVVVEVTPPGRKSGPPPLGPRLVHGTKKKKSSKYSKVKDGSQAIRKALQVKFESKTKKKKKQKGKQPVRTRSYANCEASSGGRRGGKSIRLSARSRGPAGLIL